MNRKLFRLLTISLALTGASLSFAKSSEPLKDVQFKSAEQVNPFLADDGSLIRPLPGIGTVESVLCTLPKGGTIQASRHKTVAQIWYVVSGNGEIWLHDGRGRESISTLKKGVSFVVPLGSSFQFRNSGTTDLEILIVNTTPWSGKGELVPVDNHWPPKFASLSK